MHRFNSLHPDPQLASLPAEYPAALFNERLYQSIEYARARGIREVYGEVLQENEPMLQLNKALGFTIKITPDDPALRHVTLRL